MKNIKLVVVWGFIFALTLALNMDAVVTNKTELTELVASLTYAPDQLDIAQLNATNYAAVDNFHTAWNPDNTWDKLFNSSAANQGFGSGATGGDALWGAGILFNDFGIREGFLYFTGSVFRIDEIRIFAGHPNSGRTFIHCDVAYSTGGSYIPIGTLQSGPFSVNVSQITGNGSNVFCRLYDDGGSPLASAVQSLRFTIHGTGDTTGNFENDGIEGSVYREIDVIGEKIVINVAPTADFAASTTNGPANLNVNFTDLSLNTPTSWLWDFGDGTFTNIQNPTHQYSSTGTFDVTLICLNSEGSSTNSKPNYITVTEAPLMYGFGIIAPGVWHSNYFVNTVDGPVNMNVAIVELDHPAVEVEVALANDSCYLTEKVSSMAKRKGAVLGVNGDYWGTSGKPLGLCVVNREICTAPKYRTAIGITTI